jgi:hypothetical protein
LKVQTPGQQSVPDVTIVGAQGSCSVDGSATVCSISRDGPGALDFQVTAPGFKSQAVHREIAPGTTNGCCHCDIVPAFDTLTLQPS